MSRLLTRTLAAPIAVAALGLALSGCGGSSTSKTASSASSAASSAVSSASSAASSASESASTSAAAAAAGTLAASCSKIDEVMLGSPDADPAGTAKKLEDIKAEVTTPDADLLESLAAAYTAIAANPNGPTDQLTESAKALGAACESATTAPHPN